MAESGAVKTKVKALHPGDVLSRPVDELEGVGPATAKRLKALGVRTLGDLIEYFPRDYQHEFSERSVAQLTDGEIQTARGEVVAVNYVPYPRARFEATIDDGTEKCGLVFFNQGYLR